MDKIDFEDKKIASIKARLGACFIDSVVVIIAACVLCANLGSYARLSESIEQIAMLQISADMASGAADAARAAQSREEIAANVASAAQDIGLQLEFLRADMKNFASDVSVVYFGSWFVYLCVFFATSGTTVGCMLCKIRHVSARDFGSLSWPAAALKSLIWLFMYNFCFGLLFAFVLNDALRQSFADKATKSIVIENA